MQKQHNLFQLSNEIENSYSSFLDFQNKILELAQVMQVDLTKYHIDHLALRVNTEQSARNWLERLVKCGIILSDNIVNGRAIYLIKLDEPLMFAGQAVDIIELPFPKNKSYSVESWEHIEIVIPFEKNESIEEWFQRVNKQFLWKQSAILHIKLSEPKVDGERLSNPSIAVSFADKSENHVCIKVHPYSIKTIIEV